ncbi:MAG: hypothetical protein PHU25_17980 [Deltaproteobacteria bacterium]|nr:hypothetical protein [Deltaproteobacteria bacterium]
MSEAKIPFEPAAREPERNTGRKARTHWSLATNFVAAIIIALLCTLIVMAALRKPVWIEIEIAVGLVGVAMGGFYTWILYHGVSFKTDEVLTIRFRRPDPGDVGLAMDPSLVAESAAAGFAEGGPLGCLVGVVFGVILTIVVAVIMWMGFNIAVAGITVLALPLFHVFKRSVFFVLRHSEECRGRIVASLKYGVAYALLKAATLYLIVLGAHLLAAFIKSHCSGV